MKIVLYKGFEMKYLINAERFGDCNFPISLDRIISLRHGTYSDFEYPDYNNVLAVEYKSLDEYDDRIRSMILGKFKDGKNNRKFLIGKVKSISVFNFYSDFNKEDLIKIFEKFGSELI